MRRILLVLVAGFVSAFCGGSPVPSAPTQPTQTPPVLRAGLVGVGDLTFENCTLESCGFRGQGRNSGQGCAGVVRGVTRLYNADRSLRASSPAWVLDSGLVVRPGESFTYAACCLSRADIDATPYFATEFTWTDVPCGG